MSEKVIDIARKLIEKSSLTKEEYEALILGRGGEVTELLRAHAVSQREQHFGRGVFVRGLIEISSYCKNNCLYCGIRRGNTEAERYRLIKEEILECAREGYALGLRTFVLQGGEDPYFTDEVVSDIVRSIKLLCPDAAVTLSLGERSRDSYKALKEAGADRYLLRHETATEEHYSRLHPKEMSFEKRMACLEDLKDLGYQTGAGFMVGSPFQTAADLARDLKFIEEFRPEMCGIGPFIPHKNSVFKDHPAGGVELTCFLLSVIRIILPTVLLPATTALGSIMDGGRELGILSGANVVMPNLSPMSVRAKYDLYNGKRHSGSESCEALCELEERFKKIGYHLDYSRGDSPLKV